MESAVDRLASRDRDPLLRLLHRRLPGDDV